MTREAYRGPFADLATGEAARAAAAAVEAGIVAADPATVAAFIVEPVMGNGAMTVLPTATWHWCGRSATATACCSSWTR